MSTAIATTLQPIPYLSFGGNCEEAMRFYEAALGGHITVMMRGKDTPFADQMPPVMTDKEYIAARLREQHREGTSRQGPLSTPSQFTPPQKSR